MMQYLKNEDALNFQKLGEAIIIDVRENAEFREKKLENSVNLPLSTFSPGLFEPYKQMKICLVCHSGNRATEVARRLKNLEFEQIYLLEHQIADLKSFQKSSTGWTVDRQFRMTLGGLLLLFLLGFHFWSTYFIIIPIILCTGLIFTSLIDKCYMRMGIALLPWNRGKSH